MSICYYKPINQEKPCFLEKFEIFNTTQQLLQFLVSCKDLEVFFIWLRILVFELCFRSCFADFFTYTRFYLAQVSSSFMLKIPVFLTFFVTEVLIHLRDDG